MRLILALLFTVSLSAHAGVPYEIQIKLNKLIDTQTIGWCTFSPDGKDTPRACVRYEDETDFYAIVGIPQPDGTLYPQEVRRVNKANRQEQEILWIEPTL